MSTTTNAADLDRIEREQSEARIGQLNAEIRERLSALLHES